MQALTYPLPVTVIAEIIGIPAEDRARFKALVATRPSRASASCSSAASTASASSARRQLLDEMRDYLVPLAEERERSPREDLLTGLVQAEHEGSRLSHDEMIQMLVLLLVAGNETTTTLIGNAVLELAARTREARTRCAREPALLDAAIEEVLRFSSPVQFDPRRVDARPSSSTA